MAQTFTRFNAADYLNTEQQISAYLEDAAQDDDPGAMAQALGPVARARHVSQLSRDTGSPDYGTQDDRQPCTPDST